MNLAYCPNCHQNVYTKREELNIILLVLLCIFTGGLGALIYLIVYFNKEPNRCINCGTIVKNHRVDEYQYTSSEELNKNQKFDRNLSNVNINYCPNCGTLVNESKNHSEEINFCPYCGEKLSERNTSEIKCTICHQKLHSSEQTIKCSFCGSSYHYTCVSNWLSEYNSCPTCQNQFVNPNLQIIKK